MKTKNFRANGKLLLTAEYLILEGAMGLAIPTSYGQTLAVNPENSNTLVWRSFSQGHEWFNAKFTSDFSQLIDASDKAKANYLQKILNQALNQKGKSNSFGGTITTNLEFPTNWGLGSSSTLISLVAQWLEVNEFRLGANTQGGSLYDIVCATAKRPVFYKTDGEKVFREEVLFYPDYHSCIYFVHLGKKQNTKNSVQKFKETKSYTPDDIQKVNEITNRFLKSQSAKELMGYMDLHEEIISGIIGEKKVKELFFADYMGSVKSLGAWGGDFVMAIHPNENYSLEYFKQKGFHTIVPFNKMIYQG